MTFTSLFKAVATVITLAQAVATPTHVTETRTVTPAKANTMQTEALNRDIKYSFLTQENTMSAYDMCCKQMGGEYYLIEGYYENDTVNTVDGDSYKVTDIDYWKEMVDCEEGYVVFFDNNNTPNDATDDIPLKFELFDWDSYYDITLKQDTIPTAYEMFCKGVEGRYYYIDAYYDFDKDVISTVDGDDFKVHDDYWKEMVDCEDGYVVFFDNNNTEDSSDDIPLRFELTDWEVEQTLNTRELQ